MDALVAGGRRLLDGLLTAWAAVTFTFFALRMAAGDPLAGLLSQGLATPEQVEALRASLGLDHPLGQQYVDFLRGLIRGEFGTSLYTGRDVTRVIWEQFPATAQLALASLGLAMILGLIFGVLAAWKERSLIGALAANIAGLATGLPVAFTGIIAILLFSILFQLLPDRNLHWLDDLLLPSLVLGYASSGAIARIVHSGLAETMRAPYILAARARGISSPTRLLWHALRPALPPVIALTALEAAFLFAGTVVTETVFSRPGLGRLLVSSIVQGDFPIAQGIVVLAAAVYTASQVVADAAAIALDPRLRRRA